MEAKRKLDRTKVVVEASFIVEMRRTARAKVWKRARPPAGQEETKEPPSKKQRPNGQGAPRMETAPSSNFAIKTFLECAWITT